MKNRTETIRKIVSYLNNREQDGGFWLPNIQRRFVWKEDQIERFFDSIMRQYPISTLLIWKTSSNVKHRKFIDNHHPNIKLSSYYVPKDNHLKKLVLDGQQRLQSLFIGLMGSYEGREFYIDILSGDLVVPDDIRYKFRFLKMPNEPRWIKFKDIVFSEERDNRLTRQLIDRFNEQLSDEQQDRIEDNVCQISKMFKQDEIIVYQELDSIDSPELYSEDDIVEIFIRANSGGTRLGKSDLLFSLLSSSWEESDAQMEILLEELNRTGYEFTRDFVLKTCLTLLKTGAAYNVAKLRNQDNRNAVIEKWEEISQAILDVKDFVYGKTFIKSGKAIPSYLMLLPLIYVRYHYFSKWRQATNVDEYILRTLLASAFSGSPDGLIDACINKIDNLQNWDTKEIFGVIRTHNRSLEITSESLLSNGYDSKLIHLLFNLWYRDFDYTPSYENNKPQIDHIFPQSQLGMVKEINPDTGKKNLMKYKSKDRNRLGNCMLLTAQENGAGGKSDTPPDQWFADKDNNYLDMHLIPKDKSLWILDKYDDFVAAREKLILDKFSYLMVTQD